MTTSQPSRFLASSAAPRSNTTSALHVTVVIPARPYFPPLWRHVCPFCLQYCQHKLQAGFFISLNYTMAIFYSHKIISIILFWRSLIVLRCRALYSMDVVGTSTLVRKELVFLDWCPWLIDFERYAVSALQTGFSAFKSFCVVLHENAQEAFTDS